MPFVHTLDDSDFICLGKSQFPDAPSALDLEEDNDKSIAPTQEEVVRELIYEYPPGTELPEG